MSKPAIRFIHSGSFHLECPVRGLADVPEHLRAVLLDAPYEAAQRVVDAALAEEVDFLLLSGELVECAAAGPRGPLFLVEQFQRLRQRDVPVYWATGRVDSADRWPAGIALPDNVHVFPPRPASLVFETEGRPVAELIGASYDRRRALRPAMFRPAEPALYSIAITSQSLEAESLADQRIYYWALGGRQNRGTVDDTSACAHWPGSPQGRHPTETGAHGCTLVELSGSGNPRLRYLPTDVLRWRREKLRLTPDVTIDRLQQQMRDRIAQLSAAAAHCTIVHWHVSGQGPMVHQLRRTALSEELLGWLRNEFGGGQRRVWSSDITVDAQAPVVDEADGQDTLLGEFLRTIHDHAAHVEGGPRWDPLPIDNEAAAAACKAAGWSDSDGRRRIIADAAALGADLLGAPHFEIREGQDG